MKNYFRTMLPIAITALAMSTCFAENIDVLFVHKRLSTGKDPSYPLYLHGNVCKVNNAHSATTEEGLYLGQSHADTLKHIRFWAPDPWGHYQIRLACTYKPYYMSWYFVKVEKREFILKKTDKKLVIEASCPEAVNGFLSPSEISISAE
jgi:hypothetical protein